MTADLEKQFQAALKAADLRPDRAGYLYQQLRTLWHCGYTYGCLAGHADVIGALDRLLKPSDHDHIEKEQP